jgi:hypothetical protein
VADAVEVRGAFAAARFGETEPAIGAVPVQAPGITPAPFVVRLAGPALSRSGLREARYAFASLHPPVAAPGEGAAERSGSNTPPVPRLR